MQWDFSIVDVVLVLTDSVDPTAYWRKLKQRLKMTAADGKKRLTDVADTGKPVLSDKKASDFNELISDIITGILPEEKDKK